MSTKHRHGSRGRPRQPVPKTLPDDLYDYDDDPTPRVSPPRGRPLHLFDVERLPVIDDWPEDVPITDLRLTVPASRFFEVDERMNPIAESPVDGTGADVRTPRPVGELDLDTAFGGLTLTPMAGEPDASVRGASAWLEAPDGRRLTLWQNADWGYVQVFTTQIFPKAGERVAAVAVEPMTAPPDALNSGQGLIWLEPGERWEGSWGLVYGA